MKAVVVAAGEIDPLDRHVLSGADVLIAADAGIHVLRGWGVHADVLVGDLESLTAEELAVVRGTGTRVTRHSTVKDETDLELAVREAIERGADDVTVLGALGGSRLDHELANLLLLVGAPLRGRRVRLQRGPLVVRAVCAGETLAIEAPLGSLVSLLPVGGPAGGVRTQGLRYPLDEETLPLGLPRGVSNVVDAAGATVSLALGSLLVIEGAIG